MEQANKVDELLEKSCYVIDFLPKQVKPDTGGQYFDIEYYLLNSEKHFSLSFRRIVLAETGGKRSAECRFPVLNASSAVSRDLSFKESCSSLSTSHQTLGGGY